VGDFVPYVLLEGFDEFLFPGLTIGAIMHKYMRIYLWSASRIKVFRDMLTSRA
jgi:hypothetical protein